ncbi:MAG: type 4 pilus major pilin [Gluconobacter oxydans]
MERLVAYIAGAIIAMLALGGVGIYAMRAYHGSGTTTAIAEATDIWHSARSVFGATVAGGIENYSGVNNSNSIRAGVVPSAMTNGDSQTIVGPWQGSTVTLSGNSNTFYEDWNGVPSTSCAQFALSQATNIVWANGTGIWVNNTSSNVASSIAAACNQGNNSLSEVKFSYVDTAGQ